MGNVIGSNIFNLGFILGLSAIVAPILIKRKIVYRDGIFLLIITGMIFTMLWDQQVMWWEGIILLVSLIGYISYLWIKKEAPAEEEVDTSKPKLKNLAYVFLGLIALSFIHPMTKN